MQRGYDGFANGFVNLVATSFDVFQVLIHVQLQVVEIDQSDGALAIDVKVYGIQVVDEMKFAG